ncbi:hypothetical protein AWB99_05430 [Mycolicibacterium confluentis]|nr:hypothetical protein AWB99_05430 [Mycolicibacterium confluentis]
MEFDTDHMRAGATCSHTAAEHAELARETLNRATVASGIFGDFGGARAFHSAVTTAHSCNTDVAATHRDCLETLGGSVLGIASTFDAMEHTHTEWIRDVR